MRTLRALAALLALAACHEGDVDLHKGSAVPPAVQTVLDARRAAKSATKPAGTKSVRASLVRRPAEVVNRTASGSGYAKHVVLIVADDLQPDAVRAYDNLPLNTVPTTHRGVFQYVPTPHLDALARDGAIFAR